MEKIITFKYLFSFSPDDIREFVIRLDEETLNLIPQKISKDPWTKLSCCKCSVCPLDEKDNPYCPVAVNLFDLIDFFKNMSSCQQVDISLITPEREYRKHIDLQQFLSSMMGIFMVTSGCPVMDKLRPMVRFHLPFATIEETVYRMVSMYLVGQYFKNVEQKQPDWELKKLPQMYSAVSEVNRSFCDRLRQIETQDASLNAVCILDSFASSVSYSIDDSLKSIKKLFKSYLKE